MNLVLNLQRNEQEEHLLILKGGKVKISADNKMYDNLYSQIGRYLDFYIPNLDTSDRNQICELVGHYTMPDGSIPLENFHGIFKALDKKSTMNTNLSSLSTEVTETSAFRVILRETPRHRQNQLCVESFSDSALQCLMSKCP